MDILKHRKETSAQSSDPLESLAAALFRPWASTASTRAPAL